MLTHFAKAFSILENVSAKWARIFHFCKMSAQFVKCLFQISVDAFLFFSRNSLRFSVSLRFYFTSINIHTITNDAYYFPYDISWLEFYYMIFIVYDGNEHYNLIKNENKSIKDIAKELYYSLYSIQHRGQESCGIAISDGEKINYNKWNGVLILWEKKICKMVITVLQWTCYNSTTVDYIVFRHEKTPHHWCLFSFSLS